MPPDFREFQMHFVRWIIAAFFGPDVIGTYLPYWVPPPGTALSATRRDVPRRAVEQYSEG